MTAPNHLSWDNFRATVLVPGQQRLHRICASPRIEVFSDGVTQRVGLLISVPQGAIIPPDVEKLAIIHSRLISDAGTALLEVSTSERSLHRHFYHFATAVAERVLLTKCPAMDAVALEWGCFTELLEEAAVLGLERQIGLIGELLLLRRLLNKVGSVALDSWIGPRGEPHDFRLGAREFEVKTTVSPRRLHTIHGMEQLVASDSCTLYLISILLGPPGSAPGFSLDSLVAAVSSQLEATPGRVDQLKTALEACGFRPRDAKHYSRQFALRRPIAVVPVDAACPIISRHALHQLLGSRAMRVAALQYDIDVEGLEYEEGTPAFADAFPT